jgi:hypothetical protein
MAKIELTNQQVVDKVYAHLKEQGKPARDFTGQCFYRGPGGTRCAVGCLIPPRFYNPQMENKNIDSIVFQTTFGDLFPKKQISLLNQLQLIHDNWMAPFEFSYIHERMRRLCKDFKLNFPGEPANV